jgi:hypothetical protein
MGLTALASTVSVAVCWGGRSEPAAEVVPRAADGERRAACARMAAVVGRVAASHIFLAQMWRTSALLVLAGLARLDADFVILGAPIYDHVVITHCEYRYYGE